MGMGEPLLNYTATEKSLKILFMILAIKLAEQELLFQPQVSHIKLLNLPIAEQELNLHFTAFLL